MPGERNQPPSWVRYAGLGLELAAVVVGLTLLGAWVDGRYDVDPWGTLAGFGLGLLTGFYSFIRSARAALTAAGNSDRHKRHDHNG